jgi:hypothetical protein
MQFDLIRLVLVSRAQTSLFELLSAGGEPLNREAWLRQVFSAEITFQHRQHEFHFVPEAGTTGPFIAGRIGRQIRTIENEPPEKGFGETIREPWQASIVIIDPSNHPDGQKLAFENKSQIGNPLSIIKSLVTSINSLRDHLYIIEANSIIDADTFWDFESQNRGKIIAITFELIAPNMFGIRDDLTKELTEFRDNEKARKIKISLFNEDGLKLDDNRVRETVKYAVEGGGEIKARTKNRRKTFDSAKRGKKVSVDIPKEEIQVESISTLINKAVTAIFGSLV